MQASFRKIILYTGHRTYNCQSNKNANAIDESARKSFSSKTNYDRNDGSSKQDLVDTILEVLEYKTEQCLCFCLSKDILTKSTNKVSIINGR